MFSASLPITISKCQEFGFDLFVVHATVVDSCSHVTVGEQRRDHILMCLMDVSIDATHFCP